jgi:hypothetical protein
MSKIKFPDWEREKWKDFSGNPIVEHIDGSVDRHAIGDPQIILPGEYDEVWHMFFHANGAEAKDVSFMHCISDDGIIWKTEYSLNWQLGPTCLTSDGNKWYLYYTRCLSTMDENDVNTVVSVRTSYNLKDWSESADLIIPELEWEREGKKIQARNPCMVILPDGKYRLYYAAGTIWFNDTGYEEPKYISFAESESLMGPFIKYGKPVIAPDKDIWYKNFGSGAMRVYKYGDYFLGMINYIYTDIEKHSRSAICVAMSEDGISWEDAPYNPIILPADGWKKAMVYQLDLRFREGKLLLYYNARDEWWNGTECIGLSTLDWNGTIPEKMWKLPEGGNI